MMKKTIPKKIILCGMFTALALISFLIENLFPPLFISGARIGISNVFVLLAIIYIGYMWGLLSIILKCLLGSILSGNISALIYSLPSGIISICVEIFLLCFTKKLSIVSISTMGATINLILQNFIFLLVTKSKYVMLYFPYYIIIGAFSGLVVGLIVYYIIKFMPQNIKTS